MEKLKIEQKHQIDYLYKNGRKTTHGIVHTGFSSFRMLWLVKKVGLN